MKHLFPQNWSITTQLSVALLLAALIPMITIAVFNLNGSLDALQEAEYENLELLAATTANRLDQLMSDIQSVSSMVAGDDAVVKFLTASTPEERDALRLRTQKALDNAFASNDSYLAVYIINTEARIVVISSDITRDPPTSDYSHREYFQQSIAGEPFIDMVVGVQTQELGLYISSPVYVDGEIVGVAVITISGEAIREVVEALEVGKEGYAFLIDQDGVLVSHPNPDLLYHSLGQLDQEVERRVGGRFAIEGCTDPDDLSNCQVSSLNIAELEAIGQASVSDHASYDFIDGTPMIAGYAPMQQSNLHWVIGVSEPKSEFTAPLNHLARQTLLRVLVAGVIVMVLALGLAQGIAQPVRSLTTAALALDQEDFEFALFRLQQAARSENEMGQLARVFVRLVKRVRQRDKRLKTLMTQQTLELQQAKRESRTSRLISQTRFPDQG